MTVLDDGAALHDVRRLGDTLVAGWFDAARWEAACRVDGRGEERLVRIDISLAKT